MTCPHCTHQINPWDTHVCPTVRDRLNDLERELAQQDDRNVEEYRKRHPDHVAAIDALRDVLELLDVHEQHAEPEHAQGINATAHATRYTIARRLDGVA